jgi:hypothetical protein
MSVDESIEMYKTNMQNDLGLVKEGLIGLATAMVGMFAFEYYLAIGMDSCKYMPEALEAYGLIASTCAAVGAKNYVTNLRAVQKEEAMHDNCR